MGRMRASNRNKTLHQDYKPLECLVVDYKGPLEPRTVHQNTGFYLLSDHRTGGVWAYPCPNKGEIVLSSILHQFFDLTISPTCFQSRL
jgi:hypothetical protein